MHDLFRTIFPCITFFGTSPTSPLPPSITFLVLLTLTNTSPSSDYLGGDEWKVVADKLGFDGDDIRCFDNRFPNPFKVILESCTGLTVGQLYDVLVECGFPVLADML